MGNFLQIITKIASDIKEIKARQATQNDSYEYYVYRTQNLYELNAGYDREYRLEFIPEGKKEGAICIFQDFDMTFSSSGGSRETNEPFVYRFFPMTFGKVFPAFQQKIYVSCISNRKGTLLVTRVS